MGAEHQQQFRDTVAAAQVSGDWDAAANKLSSLAMFDILPALASITPAQVDQVMQAGRRCLVDGAYRRIEYGKNVVRFHNMPTNDFGLPNDQVEDARNFLDQVMRPTPSQSGTATFISADAAGIAAILEINPASQAVQREFAGSIFRRGTQFGFTAPVRGDIDSSDSNLPVPTGMVRVGAYHTHPDFGTNKENFSPQDIMICRGQGVLFYLGTPNGRIKKLTPPSLLTGADASRFGIFGKQDILR